MADGILQFPFRITPQGTAATVPYGSDEEVEQLIAVLVLTQMGERPMNPVYGIPDPVFAGLHTGDVQVGLDEFGPQGIVVETVTMDFISDTNAVADVRWRRADSEE